MPHDILRWADAYRELTGKWPTSSSGAIAGTIGESWSQVNAALRQGLRGLPGGSSLARFLTEHRGARNIHGLAPLSEAQILAWADAHRQRTGAWPTAKSGSIHDVPGEKWAGINDALQAGGRCLPGGSSLARLLATHRGVRNRKALPPLTQEQILSWADLHYRRTGAWPTRSGGPILEAPGETWMAVEMALNHGQRGLPGGTSLARLLADQRGIRNPAYASDLSVPQILAWADAFRERVGRWPQMKSGPLLDAPGETWAAIDSALKNGHRSLPGGSSLARLLAHERGARNPTSLPSFSRKDILAWAESHHRRTGRWPQRDSGPISEAPGETWSAVDLALQKGFRGLRGGSSLARLLAARRGVRHYRDLPPLSRKKILAWADAHHDRTGAWPNVNSGAVQEAPDECWYNIDNCLRVGLRGLSGGSSLLLLLVKKRGLRNPLALPPLTEEQILRWAQLHCQRTGAWPQYKSGPIVDAPGETWSAVDSSLRYGKRGQPGQSSLAKLLARQRREERTDQPANHAEPPPE
jgi:hypothetical protein